MLRFDILPNSDDYDIAFNAPLRLAGFNGPRSSSVIFPGNLRLYNKRGNFFSVCFHSDRRHELYDLAALGHSAIYFVRKSCHISYSPAVNAFHIIRTEAHGCT
ncbi:hypothetical protein SDC9_141230 [bioreactor metagenome]|uniref:Uncharacterized protein n=1 Tax=bioreactor metagenome TaxID=1076179 RepID=A0A645DXI0_9ZZZZ